MARINMKNIVIKGVSTPNSIMLISKERGIAPADVFVRIVFDYEGEEYKASNKLKYLTKTGYQTLLDSKATEEAIDILYDPEKQYFDIDYGTTVDSLFDTVATVATVTETKSTETKKSDVNVIADKLSAIIGG